MGRRADESGLSTEAMLSTDTSGLREILLSWDPIGTQTNDPRGPADEYDCLLLPLVKTIANGADSEGISGFLRKYAKRHFGMNVQPSAEVTDQIMAWATATLAQKHCYSASTKRLGVPTARSKRHTPTTE